MIIKAPKFDLSKERIWVLRIGLVFFSFLVLLFLSGALILFFPPHAPHHQESEVEKQLKQQGIKFPVTDQHKIGNEKNSSLLNGFFALGTALSFAFGTIRPILQELRQRRQTEERTVEW